MDLNLCKCQLEGHGRQNVDGIHAGAVKLHRALVGNALKLNGHNWGPICRLIDEGKINVPEYTTENNNKIHQLNQKKN